MVNDDILSIHTTKSVAFMMSNFLITQTETNVTDDDVIGRYHKRIICDTNTITRCSLACNGHIATTQLKLALKMYSSRNIKNNSSSTATAACPTKRTFRIRIFKRCYMINRSTTATRSISTIAFRTRKG